MKDITKNVIKEEDSEECASCLSDVKSKPYYIKKISSCSEDSIAKIREKYLFNIGKSGEVGARYIIGKLIEYSKR